MSIASFPGVSPSSLFYTRDFIYAKLLCREKGGGSLGGFDHVRTLMTRSVSIVSTYGSPKE